MKAGIGMSAENHVASTICGAVVGVCGQVVEKLVHGTLVASVAVACWELRVLRVTRSLLSTARA